MAYRYVGPVDGADAAVGVGAWLETFLLAVDVAVEQAQLFVRQLAHLKDQWTDRYLAYRAANGAVRQPRADAAVMRLLPLLPEVPVTTPYSAQQLLGVSGPAARAALEELADARILSRKKVDRGTTAYLAREVFDLLTITERRLASTKWDTRKAAPRRPSPARPSSP
jgi:hypothetical protein